MRAEVGLAAAGVRHVRVHLGRGQIRMAEHLLHAPEVGTALQEVGREGMAQEVRVDALGLEACLGREPAEDQEGSGSGQRPSLRVKEELWTVALVQVRTATRQ